MKPNIDLMDSTPQDFICTARVLVDGKHVERKGTIEKDEDISQRRVLSPGGEAQYERT